MRVMSSYERWYKAGAFMFVLMVALVIAFPAVWYVWAGVTLLGSATCLVIGQF